MAVVVMEAERLVWALGVSMELIDDLVMYDMADIDDRGRIVMGQSLFKQLEKASDERDNDWY